MAACSDKQIHRYQLEIILSSPPHRRFSIHHNTGYSHKNKFARVQMNVARTNNAVEGWHHGLEATLGVNHPTMWKFLDAMLSKIRYQELEMAQILAGQAVQHHRQQWAQLNRRLATICARYVHGMEYITYLRAIALNFHYH